MDKKYCDSCEHGKHIRSGDDGFHYFRCNYRKDWAIVHECNYEYEHCPFNRKPLAYIVKELIIRDRQTNQLTRSADYSTLEEFNVDINDLRFLTTHELAMQPGVEQNTLQGKLKDYDYLIDYIVPSGAQSSNMNVCMVLAFIFPYAPYFNLLEWQGRDKCYQVKRIPNMFYKKNS